MAEIPQIAKEKLIDDIGEELFAVFEEYLQDVQESIIGEVEETFDDVLGDIDSIKKGLQELQARPSFEKPLQAFKAEVAALLNGIPKVDEEKLLEGVIRETSKRFSTAGLESELSRTVAAVAALQELINRQSASRALKDKETNKLIESLQDELRKRLASIESRGTGASMYPAVQSSFETTSRNLAAYPYTFVFNTNGTINTITYQTPNGNIVKTFSWNTDGTVASIVLSGATPSGIRKTKTFTWAAGAPAAITYS